MAEKDQDLWTQDDELDDEELDSADDEIDWDDEDFEAPPGIVPDEEERENDLASG